MTQTFSAKQVATRIGTDAKTLRKFLRSPSSPYIAVGQGSRYEFPVEDLAQIKKLFSKWQVKKAATTPKPAAEVKKVVDAIKTGSNRIMAQAHAVVMGDKGKCLKCGGPSDSPLHIKPPTYSDYDDPNSDWQEFDGEPTQADLDEAEELLDGLDDE